MTGTSRHRRRDRRRVNVTAVSAELPLSRSEPTAGVLAPLTVGLLILALVLPPLLGRRFAKPRKDRT